MPQFQPKQTFRSDPFLPSAIAWGLGFIVIWNILLPLLR